ncbi:sensor histidine kinase [Fictibacillus enclensis]|uniref:sensor histidine kinase n=1 Tax=Fictibacillus enclensis TaxID=1017270 RepID=UPI0025A2B5ED|nr:sensor histidine kinase [Fictibacillus enclensis]MDM5336184.1 sensor histidine kinase [Fictibacillus enclensis]
MLQLLPLMLERAGVLVMVAFLLSRLRSFRQIVHQEHNRKEKMLLILIFGAFGVISNYTGIEINNGSIVSQTWQADVDYDAAIANTRIMGVAIGGLLGGPIVGLGVGLIAGLHRLTLGGFTAEACAISTILAGLITGWLGRRFGIIGRNRSPWGAVAVGILMEIIQMGVILLIARPFEAASHLVEVIAIPMITINGLGTLIFIMIIQSILMEEERTRALQTHNALQIAQQTLPFFRQGLNFHSCGEAAKIILKATKADAISITDKEQVLAHAGAASDHHQPGQNMATLLTKKVIENGKILIARSTEEIQCYRENCPLQAAIVVPLQVRDETVGSLKLYFEDQDKLDQVEQELAEGLSKLFSTQLELAEAEWQQKLLKDAEVKALQAQVHPHFLFNAINTISSLVRTDAPKARKLLIQLGVFFRSNLQGARHLLIPLEKEIEHVEAYLSLEQARFPGKYEVEFDIEPQLNHVLIPPFTLQPLVENAIRHAFSSKKQGNVKVTAYMDQDKMMLTTEDNGKGIPADLIQSLGKESVQSAEGTGTALWNIRKRIQEIYGLEDSFLIESEQDAGTKVTMTLPLTQNKWSENDV